MTAASDSLSKKYDLQNRIHLLEEERKKLVEENHIIPYNNFKQKYLALDKDIRELNERLDAL